MKFQWRLHNRHPPAHPHRSTTTNINRGIFATEYPPGSVQIILHSASRHADINRQVGMRLEHPCSIRIWAQAFKQPDQWRNIVTTKVVILSSAIPGNLGSFQEYLQGVNPLMQAAKVGATFIGAFAEGLDGSDFPENVLLLDFESDDAARSFFASNAYQTLIPARDRALKNVQIFIANKQEG